jgi:hypothetical protein
MVEKAIDEIGWMGRSKKQKEDGMKFRKSEDGIRNIGRTRGIWMTESRNVEADGERLRPVGVARGTSTAGGDKGDEGGTPAIEDLNS